MPKVLMVVALLLVASLATGAIAGPVPGGISYEAFLNEKVVTLPNLQTLDSMSRQPYLPAHDSTQVTHSTGVLQLVNTTEWSGVAGYTIVSSLCAMNSYLYAALPYGVLTFDMTDPAHPRLVGKYFDPSPVPGAVRELKGENGLLYLLTAQEGLKILDATAPAQLQLRASLSWPSFGPCNNQTMEVSGGFIYAISQTDTLYIVDVTNPDNPAVRSKLTGGDIAWAQGFVGLLDGDDKMLYLSSSSINTPLVTINVSNPDYPVFVSTYWGARDGLPPFAGKLVRSGYNLMAFGPRWPKSGGPNYLKVMDLASSPLFPQFACSTLVQGYVLDYTVSDGRLYVSQGGTVCTYDITDPCAPRQLACVPLGTQGYADVDWMLVQDGWLYSQAADDRGSLPAFWVEASNMADPAAPQMHVVYKAKKSRQLTASESTPVAVSASYTWWQSARLFDVSQPTTPQAGSDIGPSTGGSGSWQTGMDLVGSRLYLSGDCGCLGTYSAPTVACIDATNPASAYYRWSLNLPWQRNVTFRDVANSGNYCFVPAEDSGLFVIQEKTPSSAAIVANIALPEQAQHIAVVGNRAYVVCWGHRYIDWTYDGAYLAVVDISNPAAPSVIGFQEPWGQYNIEAYGNRLAATTWNLDHWVVTIYDIDSTGWPAIVGTYDPPDWSGDCRVLKLHGDYLYTWSGNRLDVVDISNPAVPVCIDEYPTLGSFYDVAIRGDIIYLGEYYGTKILRGPNCCEGTVGNINLSGIVDLADLSRLISFLTVTGAPALVCSAEADFNASGVVDLSDLSFLIAYLVGSPKPSLPSCP